MSYKQDLLRLGPLLDNSPPHNPGALLAAQLLRIRDRSGSLIRLQANPAQRAFHQRQGLHNIVLKARQMGITTWIAGQYLLRTITHPGTLTVQVAHTREAAESLFATVVRMVNHLPEAWLAGPLRLSRATSGRMVFGTIDSEFRVVSAGEANAGRGLTIHNLHLSELARWPGDAQATLAGLRAALVPNGRMTLESTPAGAHGAFYEQWNAASENGMVQHFFPWWLENAYRSGPPDDFTEEERTLMTKTGLDAAQIGFRRDLDRGFRALRAQEFAEDPESCFKASGECCFPIDIVDRALARTRKPVETRRAGALHIWFPPARGREYLLGVDSAGGGTAGDFAAIQVIDSASGLQCAELREHLGPLELARIAAALAREYNHALLVVERNNHGAAVLAYLDAVEDYRRLYEHAGVAGWLTSAGNKPAMIGRIGALLEETTLLFMSRRLLTECRSYIAHANGATCAAPGAHDDCLMAMAIAHSGRSQAFR